MRKQQSIKRRRTLFDCAKLSVIRKVLHSNFSELFSYLLKIYGGSYYKSIHKS